MNKVMIYEPEHGLKGTIEELIDWAYRYSTDYSDEALERISALAKSFGLPEEKYMIPIYVLKARKRNEDTLPYEQMKLDWILYEKISFSESKEYGEVEVFSDRGKVLISITGNDSEGYFTAVGAYSIEEFMQGGDNFLESAVGQVLFYSKQYPEDDE